MFQNSKIIWLLKLVLWLLASFSCMMHFVCRKQKEESFFFVTAIQASLIGWVFNQLKTLTNRSTFFLQNCSVVVGFFFQFQKKIEGGGGKRGSHQWIQLGEGGGCAGPKKNLQVWDPQRLAPLILYMYFTQDWSSHICHSYIHWQENALVFLSPNIKTLKLHQHTIKKLLMRPYHIDHGTDVQHKSVYKA